MTSLMFAGIGSVLLVAGPVLVYHGVTARKQIQSELARQRIVFPDAGRLPATLARLAGTQVRTGRQALAFAEIIATNVSRATGDRTYAQIVDEWHATGRTDDQLAQLRETAFMGQMLRGSLLGAYQAWQITALVIGLGGLLTALGFGVLASAVAGA